MWGWGEWKHMLTLGSTPSTMPFPLPLPPPKKKELSMKWKFNFQVIRRAFYIFNTLLLKKKKEKKTLKFTLKNTANTIRVCWLPWERYYYEWETQNEIQAKVAGSSLCLLLPCPKLAHSVSHFYPLLFLQSLHSFKYMCLCLIRVLQLTPSSLTFSETFQY